MDELKKKVAAEVGITDAQADASIGIIVKYIKDRVPGIVHNQLDKIVAGMSLEDSIRNQVEDLGGEVRDRAEGLANDLRNAFEGAFKSNKGKTP